jgi:hypothetical protein
VKLQALLHHIASSEYLTGMEVGGLTNIETGFIELSSDFFGPCPCSTEGQLVTSCDLCGRRPGNHVRLLAGRGDGVYAGVSFMANEGRKLIATVVLLDDGNAFAAEVNSFIERDSSATLDALTAQSSAPYAALAVNEVARVDTNARGLLIGDADAGLMSNGAVFSQLETAQQQFRVFLVCEPATAGEDLQFAIATNPALEAEITGGYPDALRPRLVLVVDSSFPLPTDTEGESDSHDWAAQGHAWRKALVGANTGGGNNVVAAYFNGLAWRLKQAEISQEPDFGGDEFADLGTLAFGWFLLGALWGDDDCLAYVIHMIHESDGLLAAPEALSDALWLRGWEITPAVSELVAVASRSSCEWCRS